MTHFQCTCCGAIFDSRDASPEPPDRPPPSVLLILIYEKAGGNWFYSGKFYRAAEMENLAAVARQEPTPAIWLAMQDQRIISSHSFGEWLSERDKEGTVEKSKRQAAGRLWRVRAPAPRKSSKSV